MDSILYHYHAHLVILEVYWFSAKNSPFLNCNWIQHRKIHNLNDKEHNNSRKTTFLHGFGDKLISYDMTFEDFPMLEEMSSLDGLDGKFNKDIKVKWFPLLLERSYINELGY